MNAKKLVWTREIETTTTLVSSGTRMDILVSERQSGNFGLLTSKSAE